MSTGFATLPSPGSTSRSAARVSSASSGSSSPAASQASAQRIPSPPAFVSTPTRRPRGSGWLESSARHVDQLLERPRPQTRPPGGRARRRPPRSRPAQPCASSPPCAPAAVAPALSARIGLRRATRRERRRELARVAERLEVEQHDVRLRVVLPPLEQVVRGDVRLVPDRDEGGEAEPRRAPARAAPARARRTARRSRSGPAAARAARRSRSGFGFDEAMPRQFGPSSRAPCARTSASSCSCRSRPSSPVSAKPEEITQSARTPLRQRLLGRLQHPRRREADHRELDLVRDLRDRAVARARRRRARRRGSPGRRRRRSRLRACCGRARRRSSRAGARRRSRRRSPARRTAAARRRRRRGRAPRPAPGTSRSPRSGS